MTDFNTQPALDHAEITASDSTEYAPAYRALFVGGGGDVSLVSPKGNTSVFKNVPSGSILPARFTQVLATDTTATDLVGLL